MTKLTFRAQHVPRAASCRVNAEGQEAERAGGRRAGSWRMVIAKSYTYDRRWRGDVIVKYRAA